MKSLSLLAGRTVAHASLVNNALSCNEGSGEAVQVQRLAVAARIHKV